MKVGFKKGDIIIYKGIKETKVGKFIEYSNNVIMEVSINQWIDGRFRARTRIKFSQIITKGGKNYKDTMNNFPEYFI